MKKERRSDGDLELRALFTPGHTDDSYCFILKDKIFTGDTLLIGGTGRTDFQNGNAEDITKQENFEIYPELPLKIV